MAYRERHGLTHALALRDQFFIASGIDPDNGDTFFGDFDLSEQVPVIIAAKNNAAATRRSVLKQLILTQRRVVSDAPLLLWTALDPTYRYGSGGVQVTPVSVRPQWTTAGTEHRAQLEVYYGSASDPGLASPELLATAPNANTRWMHPIAIQAAEGLTQAIDLESELWVNAVGSVLFYLVAEDGATIAPESAFQLSFVEEPLPS